MKKYCIIFDTNVLFRNYDRYADFTCFSFADVLDCVIEEIEKRDIYDAVKILIPKVVWQETRQQNIEKYNEKLIAIKDKHNKLKLPFHTFDGQDKDYEEFLDNRIKEYKKNLKNKMVVVEELPGPTRDCYYSLVKRVYDKRPPFEGKDKKSDKGFKDALLWESVLQYKKKHPDEHIFLYTNDGMFNDELKQEYGQVFDGEEILFFKDATESDLIDKLSQIALDKDATFPVPDKDRSSALKRYLYSSTFEEDIKNFETVIIGHNEYLHIASVKLLNVTNSIEVYIGDDMIKEYTVFAKCKFMIEANEETYFEIEKDLVVGISATDDTIFQIEDVCIDTEENKNG